METREKDRAGIQVPPPMFFLACLAAGLLAERLFPVGVFAVTGAWARVAGWLLVCLSVLLVAGAMAVLIRNGTPFDPARPTQRIVRQGVFRFSRNPMYLALLLLLGGIALLRASLWLGLAVVLLFALLRRFAVEPEEKYLADKFGDNYLAYKGSVRRWI